GPRRVPDEIGLQSRVGVRPVVVLLPVAAWQPTDVRAVAVRALELLVGDVAILVPVLVFLGDAEVHERAIPEVGKAHPARNGNSQSGFSLLFSWGKRPVPPRAPFPAFELGDPRNRC